MYRSVSTTFFILCLLLSLTAQKYTYYDGPYISVDGNQLGVTSIQNGELKKEASTSSNYHFKADGLPEVYIEQIEYPDEPFIKYNNVSKYVALSDIHGQYDLFVDLLQAQGVIDNDLQWSYGDGHLVIVGDMMDRGPKVTEVLWLLYSLEKQALTSGGKVHIILGNHELMVLHGNLRYIHKKYNYTAGATRTRYQEFFSKNTILGRWLRSKNVVAVINDVGFVHGGFSQQVVSLEPSLEKVNTIFKKDLIPKESVQRGSEEDIANILYFENGPLWYRGYADPQGFDAEQAKQILKLLKLKKIVVGHTSMPQIFMIADGQIILVDSSIKFGDDGEVLVYEGGSYYRGMTDGQKLPLQSSNLKVDYTTIFEHIKSKSANGNVQLVLDTHFGDILNKKRNKEEYQPAVLTVYGSDELTDPLQVQVRTRGNMRKQACRLPPIKMNFSKKDLRALGFRELDRLKFVFPCQKGSSSEQGLYKEALLYKIYDAIDPSSLSTYLVDINIKDRGKDKYQFKTLIVEEESHYQWRTGHKIKKLKVQDQSIERESYLRFMFFQYLIFNTDFGINNLHNIEIYQSDGHSLPLILPYDFDYAGMVDQPYAVPHESMPIKDVKQRYFRGKAVTKEEVKKMRDFFNQKRMAIEKVISEDPYVSEKGRSRMLNDTKAFYNILNNEKKWKSAFYLK